MQYCRIKKKFIFKCCAYDIVDKNSIIFINKNKVAVIVSGFILVKSYKENIYWPKEISLLRPGNIIGFNEIDNSRAQKYDNWFESMTIVELLYFDVNFFKVKFI